MGELAAKIRAKYPGAYDSLPDTELESKVMAKFPGVYDHLAENPSSLVIRQDATYTKDPKVIERERRKFMSADKDNKTLKDRAQIVSDYFTTPNEVNVWDDPLRAIPKSLANTLAALNPASAYEGLSKEAIADSFPGGNPSPEVNEELRQHSMNMAKGMAAPFGFAGAEALKESWGKNPVGSALMVAPTVKPAMATLSSLGRKVTAPIRAGLPGTDKYYKAQAGSQLRDVLIDERGNVGQSIPEASTRPGDPLAMQKPQAAREMEAINAAETSRLKDLYGVEPTLAQETNNVRAAMLEQSLAAKNPDLAEALKYKDAAINQAGIKNIQRTLGEGKPLPYAPTEQAIGTKIVDAIDSIRTPAKAKVSAMYKDIPNFQIDNAPLVSAVEQVRGAKLPRTQKTKINDIADYIMDEVGENTSMGFQELHAIRKTLGTMINDATKGMSPDNTTAKFAGDLKRAVDDMIDSTPELPEIYKSAKKAYQDYADQFNTGVTAEVLQRGNEASGRKLPPEVVAKRYFSSETAADDLVRAVGAPKAKEAMRQYAVSDLIKKTTDIDGNMNINRSLAWLRQNKPVLEKLGLTEEVRGVISGQVPKAIMRTIEGKRVDVLNNPALTLSESRKLLAEYKPALRQLFKDNEALVALEDYHKLMQMLSRNKNVTYSGSSSTVEKGSMSSFFTTAAKTGLNAWASKLSRGLWDVISGYGDKQINAILKDAVMNPETAKSLMNLAENANDIKAAKALNFRMGQMGMAVDKLRDQRGVVGKDINAADLRAQAIADREQMYKDYTAELDKTRPVLGNKLESKPQGKLVIPALTIEQVPMALKKSGFTESEITRVVGHLNEVVDYGNTLLKKAGQKPDSNPIFGKQDIQEAIDAVITRKSTNSPISNVTRNLR